MRFLIRGMKIIPVGLTMRDKGWRQRDQTRSHFFRGAKFLVDLCYGEGDSQVRPRLSRALGVKTGPPAGPVGLETKVADRNIEGAASAAPFVFVSSLSLSLRCDMRLPQPALCSPCSII